MAATRIRRTAVAVLVAATVTAACTAPPIAPMPTAMPTAPMPADSASTPPESPPAPATGPRYVAMGDSAAAAPLVPQQAVPAGCLRSTNDYPAVLARQLRVTSFTDVTCSGARTEDLDSRSQSTRTGPVPPQVDALAADTQLVTITVGGNDIDLPANAMKCRRDDLDEPPCATDFVVDGVDAISRTIDENAGDWSNLVAAVRAKAPAARVILVGYGTYVRPEGCFPAEPINPVDAVYFQAKVDELDDRLSRVAAAKGVEFFDTRALSVGHDICAPAADRYVEGFVPVNPAAPLHPNGMGAAAVGTALATYVGS